MSERQKRKKAKELEKASMSPKEPPSKLQKSITQWLRKNVPSKKTKFLHAHEVEFFTASKAIGRYNSFRPTYKRILFPKNQAS